MYKKDIIAGSVFQLKSKHSCLVEIAKVLKTQADINEYSEDGCKSCSVDISDLEGILLSVPILKSIGFEKKEGPLMGLPCEKYWIKHLDGYNLCFAEESDGVKYACVDGDAFYGIKLLPPPYLHELQSIIGAIDTEKLFCDLYCINEKE